MVRLQSAIIFPRYLSCRISWTVCGRPVWVELITYFRFILILVVNELVVSVMMVGGSLVGLEWTIMQQHENGKLIFESCKIWFLREVNLTAHKVFY